MSRLAWVLLALPSLAFADYKSDYREGLVAAERQEWARVEQWMGRAMAARPEPDPNDRVRVQGGRWVPYLPQFYLGLAAFSRRDCAAALGYLEAPKLVAAVRGLREAERQALMVRSCRARLGVAAGQPPTPSADTPPSNQVPATPAAAATPGWDAARASQLEQRITQLETRLARARSGLADPALAVARPNFERRLAPATGQLQQVRAALAAARERRDPAALAAVEREVAVLDAAAQKLAADLSAALERGRGTALADARSALERALQQGDARLAALAERDEREGQALARAVQQGRSNLGSSDTTVLRQSGAGIEAALRALDTAKARGALAAQLSIRLQPLVEAYLAGDFARAAGWNDAEALRAAPGAQAESLLLRAAARYELYVLGGEADLALFERIRSDVRAARQLAPGLAPSERAYSPRFRALFASTR